MYKQHFQNNIQGTGDKKQAYSIYEDLLIIQQMGQFVTAPNLSIYKQISKTLTNRSEESIRKRYQEYLKHLSSADLTTILSFIKLNGVDGIIFFEKENGVYHLKQLKKFSLSQKNNYSNNKQQQQSSNQRNDEDVKQNTKENQKPKIQHDSKTQVIQQKALENQKTTIQTQIKEVQNQQNIPPKSKTPQKQQPQSQPQIQQKQPDLQEKNQNQQQKQPEKILIEQVQNLKRKAKEAEIDNDSVETVSDKSEIDEEEQNEDNLSNEQKNKQNQQTSRKKKKSLKKHRKYQPQPIYINIPFYPPHFMQQPPPDYGMISPSKVPPMQYPQHPYYMQNFYQQPQQMPGQSPSKMGPYPPPPFYPNFNPYQFQSQQYPQQQQYYQPPHYKENQNQTFKKGFKSKQQQKQSHNQEKREISRSKSPNKIIQQSKSPQLQQQQQNQHQNDLTDYQQMLQKLADFHHITFNEILTIFDQLSADLEQLHKYFTQSNTDLMLWKEEDDEILSEIKDKNSNEMKLLIKQKGVDSIERRIQFQQLKLPFQFP